MSSSSSTGLHLGLAGAEDVNTIFNPTVSFWVTEKPTHTHFVMDYSVQDASTLVWNQTVDFVWPKGGDLVRNTLLVLDLPMCQTSGAALSTGHWVNDIGRAAWSQIDLVVGTVTINTLHSELEHCLDELENDPVNQWGELSGREEDLAALIARSATAQRVICKLGFYYTKVDGDAFPLANMIGTDVHVKVMLRPCSHLIGANVDGVANNADMTNNGKNAPTLIRLINEIVHLNDDERVAVGHAEMKLAIDNYDRFDSSLTLTGAGKENTIEMPFNHPVKDLIVLFRKATCAPGGATAGLNSVDDNNMFNFIGQETDARFKDEAFQGLKLRLNGSDYWPYMDPHMFRKYMARMRYGRVPRKHIYPFPFGLYPSSERATGELNMSKIDKRQLLVQNPASVALAATDVIVFSRHILEINFVSNTVQRSYA